MNNIVDINQYKNKLKEIEPRIIQFLTFIDPTQNELYKTLLNDTMNEMTSSEIFQLQKSQFELLENNIEDQSQYQLFLRQTITRISTMMRLFKELQLNKEYLKSIEIQKPIIIIGFPRTGSTTLFNCLSSHSQAHYFTGWQTMCPGYSTVSEESQRKFVLRLKGVMNDGNEDFEKIHAIDIDANEECIFQYDCFGLYFSHCLALPHYSQFVYHLLSSWKSLMEFEWNIYKINLMRRPMKNDQFLILKNVTLLCVLKEVLESCEDIRIVWMHRNPFDMIKSASPYFKSIQQSFLTKENQDKIEENWLCNNIIDLYNTILKKAIESRNEWIEKSPKRKNQIVDIQFDQFIQNPIKECQKIFDQFGIDCDENDIERMKLSLENDLQTQKGKLIVDDSVVTVSKEKISSLFGWYIDQYL